MPNTPGELAGCIAHATLPGGKRVPMLKTLVSSACERDCRYCPFRSGRDFRRATFTPGSRLDLDGAVRALRFLGFEAHGRAALSARIEGRWPGTARLDTTLRLDGWQLGRPEARPLLFGDGLAVDVQDHLLPIIG